jgi:hypothetical protein
MNIRTWIAVGAAAVAAATATTATAATAATTPAQHAYSQQDLQRDLDAITATGVPGVLAEVRTGDRQLRGTSGVADLDSRQPVNGNGFFRIGSNTRSPRPRRTASWNSASSAGKTCWTSRSPTGRTTPPVPPGTTPTPTTSCSAWSSKR